MAGGPISAPEPPNVARCGLEISWALTLDGPLKAAFLLRSGLGINHVLAACCEQPRRGTKGLAKLASELALSSIWLCD